MQIEGVNISQCVINEHASIFHEFIDLLADHLQQIGLGVTRTVNHINVDRTNIIVGATMFISPDEFAAIWRTAPSYIVFQVEALHGDQGYAARYPAYIEFLRSASQVWDYSSQNVQFLTEAGLSNVHYVPVGYSRGLERIAEPDAYDTDVLFYGKISPRRRELLEGFANRNFKTRVLFGAYGGARDREIARSKIQLNIHQFETFQLETLRIAYLLNNKRFVISETALDNPYGEGIVFCAYKDIVARCEHYLGPGMDAERKRIAELGYRSLKQLPMREALLNALTKLACDANRPTGGR